MPLKLDKAKHKALDAMAVATLTSLLNYFEEHVEVSMTLSLMLARFCSAVTRSEAQAHELIDMIATGAKEIDIRQGESVQ